MSQQRSLVRFAQAFVVIAVAVTLAACVTATPYQPAPPRGFGYTEERLDQNKFRVTFRGNSLTAREIVEDYLLYRAAELTLQNGYDHFLIVGRETEARTAYRYWVDHYGGRGWFYHGFPHWYDPWYRPWSTYDAQPITTYTATAEVVMIKGPRQDGEIRAFDARQVLVEVGPRVIRPEQLQR
jgi:hypothetical protein